MISTNQLLQMRTQNIESTDKSHLKDISVIHIEDMGSPEQKMLSFLEQAQNPYCFLCGQTPVGICFTDGAPELGELLKRYFIRQKEMIWTVYGALLCISVFPEMTGMMKA